MLVRFHQHIDSEDQEQQQFAFSETHYCFVPLRYKDSTLVQIGNAIHQLNNKQIESIHEDDYILILHAHQSQILLEFPKLIGADAQYYSLQSIQAGFNANRRKHLQSKVIYPRYRKRA